MKPLSGVCLLSLGVAAGSLFAAEPVVLLEAKFNKPTDVTALYPPAAGERYVLISGGVGGWSDGGQIAITYAGGYGVEGSGGLYCTLRRPGNSYVQVTMPSITFPGVDAVTLLNLDTVRRLKVSVAANLPEGQEIGVTLTPNLTKALAAKGFSNRIVLGTIKGTGKFAVYEFSPATLPESRVAGFLKTMNDALLNGTPAAQATVTFMLDTSWGEGSSFQLDDAKVTLE